MGPSGTLPVQNDTDHHPLLPSPEAAILLDMPNTIFAAADAVGELIVDLQALREDFESSGLPEDINILSCHQ